MVIGIFSEYSNKLTIIESIDFSTRYTTVTYKKLIITLTVTDIILESHSFTKIIMIDTHIWHLVTKHPTLYRSMDTNNIIQMPEFRFFLGKRFQPIVLISLVCIPIRSNYASLVVDSFLYSKLSLYNIIFLLSIEKKHRHFSSIS